MLRTIDTASEAWLNLIWGVHNAGKLIEPRGKETRELLFSRALFDMKQPVNQVISRNLGYHFMAAEAAWILQGDNRVATIAPYSKEIPNFSDDGIYFAGAYGPKVVSQLSYVVDSLLDDRDSRQAVMSIWSPNPRRTKDFPCTLTAQWMIRGHELHCSLDMRSSDTWLGVPYDWFNFTMISLAILIMIKKRSILGQDIELGTMGFKAGSQHIYKRNYDQVTECNGKPALYKFEKPVTDDGLESVDQLVENLWMLANDQSPKWPWLRDLQAALNLA